MKTKKIKTNNSGFTLVEMIVVLVILAILAAILVPGLLGYIDEAKKKEDVINAKACMNAVQSELAIQYGKYTAGSNSTNNIFDVTNGNIFFGSDDDPNLTKSEFTKRVFEKMGLTEFPYCVILYTKNVKNLSTVTSKELHDAFKLYSMVYWADEDKMPIFYNFDTNTWEDGSLYTAGFMYRGSDNKSTKNQILSGHKYAGDDIKIYFMYYNDTEKDIKKINDKIRDKVKGIK